MSDEVRDSLRTRTERLVFARTSFLIDHAAKAIQIANGSNDRNELLKNATNAVNQFQASDPVKFSPLVIAIILQLLPLLVNWFINRPKTYRREVKVLSWRLSKQWRPSMRENIDAAESVIADMKARPGSDSVLCLLLENEVFRLLANYHESIQGEASL